jgi:lysozyme
VSYLDIARTQIKADEGVRAFPYKDSVGIQTIGVGRNLEMGLRPDEIDLMLDNDLKQAEVDARFLFPAFDSLSDNRKAALLNMSFNLGRARLSAFHKMIEAVNHDDFEEAATQMLASKWAVQVGNRAQRLAKAMREG